MRAMILQSSQFRLLLCLSIVALSVGKESLKKIDDCYKPCRVKNTPPVCGSDGKNYTTNCHLSVARCQARKFGHVISLNSTGYCSSSKPLSPCAWNCSERRQMICASNKVTYKNICQFKKAKCEIRKKKLKSITILSRKGPCSKLKETAATCRKLSTCPKVKRPVCGSDDKTYTNICHLKTTNCVIKRKAQGKKFQKLSLKYCGVCGRARQCSSPWQQKCPSIKLCDQMLRALRPAGTKRGGTLKKGKANKKGKGKTRRGFPLAGKKNKMKKSKGKGFNGKMRKRVYPKFRKFMVCGSDGRTYPSICHLQIEQCTKRKKCLRLNVRNRGPCKH